MNRIATRSLYLSLLTLSACAVPSGEGAPVGSAEEVIGSGRAALDTPVNYEETFHFGGNLLEETRRVQKGGACTPGFTRVSPPKVSATGNGQCSFVDWTTSNEGDCTAIVEWHSNALWGGAQCTVRIREGQFGEKPISVITPAAGRIEVAMHNATDNLATHSWNGSAWSSEVQANNGITETPAIVATGANRLDAFVRGTDGALWTKTRFGTGWTHYTQLGSERIVGNPVAIATGANGIRVFVRRPDNTLHTKSWNGESWTGYQSLGGAFVGTPAVVARGPNRIDVLGRGTDNALWTTSWDGASWAPVTQLEPNPIASDPAAVAWDSDRVDVFVRGANGRLQTKSLVGSWNSYTELGNETFYGHPAAATWGPNRIDVFVRGTDGRLHTKSWNGSRWSAYFGLESNQFLASPSVVSWGPDRLDVFVRGTDSALYTKSWNGSEWSAYHALGGSVL